MIITALLGIAASIAAELVTKVNKALAGTVLHGRGAFLLALGASILAATVKIFYFDATPLPALADLATWKMIYPAFAQVWLASQVFFLFVVEQFHLDVQEARNADITAELAV